MSNPLFSGSRMALRNAHEWEAMATSYDRQWAEKCLKQAEEARERARLYLRLRRPFLNVETSDEQH